MTVTSKTKGHKHDYCKPGWSCIQYIAMNTSTGHSMLQNDEYYHEHPSVNNAGKEFTHTLELKKGTAHQNKSLAGNQEDLHKGKVFSESSCARYSTLVSFLENKGLPLPDCLSRAFFLKSWKSPFADITRSLAKHSSDGRPPQFNKPLCRGIVFSRNPTCSMLPLSSKISHFGQFAIGYARNANQKKESENLIQVLGT